jgi:hypothetical protein
MNRSDGSFCLQSSQHEKGSNFFNFPFFSAGGFGILRGSVVSSSYLEQGRSKTAAGHFAVLPGGRKERIILHYHILPSSVCKTVYGGV